VASHRSEIKPKRKELTKAQKQENREFSSQRVKCEHTHAGMKRYNSVTAVYRNRIPDFEVTSNPSGIECL
jgi:hypothetical protein